MTIGIIDADLLGRKRHKFPNLACEKLSGYWKEKGEEVHLLMNYDDLASYDSVYISKVFTDTPIPDEVLRYIGENNERVHIGGTGFYFDEAPALPYEIEHHMPDYELYDSWIKNECMREEELAKKQKKVFNKTTFMNKFSKYTDYSIGFTTRGCFRKCPFCVNKKFDRVLRHSPIEEFYDPSRKKICLLDDNIFGFPQWRSIFEKLIDLKKPFRFNQGMDERLLTADKCELLFEANYDGDYIFAFDNISDYDLVHKKLQLIRKHTEKMSIKFYVLVGFESTDINDIKNMWRRVALLMKFRCVPYIMRYQNKNDTPWKLSEFRETYITMARWCNQPGFYKKQSFRQFCEKNQEQVKTEGKMCTAMRVLKHFDELYPEIAEQYFDLRFDECFLQKEGDV